MKAYLVTSGSYSDYGVAEVFLNKDEADNYCFVNNVDSWNDYRVEEYEINEGHYDTSEVITKQQFVYYNGKIVEPFGFKEDMSCPEYKGVRPVLRRYLDKNYEYHYGSLINSFMVTIEYKGKKDKDVLHKIVQDKVAEYKYWYLENIEENTK